MFSSVHRPGTTNNLKRLTQSSIRTEQPALSLIVNLCRMLAEENIDYCHWKSNNALHRSASGDNDLDLLVSRADMRRFSEILYRLGFKPARAPAEKQMPGVVDYYGYDEASDRFVHVHAHYQLILGHDMTKNYRLPIEGPYLESSRQGELFRVPTHEFEFVVFIIRMVLKHSTWDAIIGLEGTLNPAERQELAYLRTRIDRERVNRILKRHLPYVSVETFDNCIQALHPTCPPWRRVQTGYQLQTKLQANARRPLLTDTYLKLWRRGTSVIRRRVLNSPPKKYRLQGGGVMLALVGGDGAGKSTAVDALYGWLSKHFETSCVHMGKPAWSWTTMTIRAILKIGNLLGLYPVEATFRETLNQKSLVSPGYPWLLREVCRARDRYWTYVKARRFAANGGIVIFDRFPVPQIKLMDGPLADRFLHQLRSGYQADSFMIPHPANRFVRALVKLEESYYHQIVPPDLLIVLLVDPEIAVQRKTNEDAASVRERSTEIWALNWDHTDAYVIDGSKSKSDVLLELKALVWATL